MKRLAIVFLLEIAVLACCFSQNDQRPINAIPEYGHQNKTEYQLQADEEFLNSVKGREDKAYIALIDEGWWFLKQGDTSTAVMRFNQAWLINQSRWEVYWSFAVAERSISNMKSARKYYLKAINLCRDTQYKDMLKQEYSDFIKKIED